MGEQMWRLLAQEHQIGPDGIIADENDYDPMLETFFIQRNSGKFEPRALFIDLDPDSIDSIRYGENSDLFDHGNLLAGKEDARNLFTEAYIGGFSDRHRGTHQQAFDKVRLAVEECDRFQGHLFTHSVSGGTGSGLTAKILEDRFSYSSK